MMLKRFCEVLEGDKSSGYLAVHVDYLFDIYRANCEIDDVM